MKNRKRTLGINIRVTPQEKKRITSHAKKCKLSVSEYLRQLANGYTPKELPNDKIYETCWQIELLLENYENKNDREFKQYLKGMLDDLHSFCYPSGKTFDNENKGELNGNY